MTSRHFLCRLGHDLRREPENPPFPATRNGKWFPKACYGRDLMEHNEIRHRLSGYTDGSVSTKEKKRNWSPSPNMFSLHRRFQRIAKSYRAWKPSRIYRQQLGWHGKSWQKSILKRQKRKVCFRRDPSCSSKDRSRPWQSCLSQYVCFISSGASNIYPLAEKYW